MHDIELNDSELLLVCEILRTDVQASLSILRDERDLEHARSVVERIVACNRLLKGLE